MVAAVVVFGIGVAGIARTITHTDAVFHASGRHAVALPAGTERGLFVPEGRPIPACQVTDGSGTALGFRRPGEQFTYDGWVAVRVFDTGDGNIVFACPPGTGGRIRIGAVPSGSDVARFGFVGLLLPLGLGGVGFVVVLVTGILWYARRPQQPAGMYGAPAGPPYAGAPGYPPGYPPVYPPGTPPPGYPPHRPGNESEDPGPSGPPEGPGSSDSLPGRWGG